MCALSGFSCCASFVIRLVLTSCNSCPIAVCSFHSAEIEVVWDGRHNSSFHLLFFFHSIFDFAFELARLSLKQKLPEIHFKYGSFLEDEVESLGFLNGCFPSWSNAGHVVNMPLLLNAGQV